MFSDLGKNTGSALLACLEDINRQSFSCTCFIWQGGLRPHNFCLPILKREEHRQAVLTAAVSGNPRFFLGTDSAPHAVGDKVCTACQPFSLLVGCAIFLLQARKGERKGSDMQYMQGQYSYRTVLYGLILQFHLTLSQDVGSQVLDQPKP